MKKIIQYFFCVIFILMLIIPLLFSNLVQGTASEAENRMLAGIAKIIKSDGSYNSKFLEEFDHWIDDNIGFRSEIVALNAKIQFYIFDCFTHNSNLSLGPKGELNSTPEEQVIKYQHFNTISQEEAIEIAGNFQKISDKLADKNIQYYYLQCYEKYSIYPEHMPTYILQYGSESKTDQVVKAIKTNTAINFVDIKQDLLEAKKYQNVYSEKGDPVHWSKEGALIAYWNLMKLVNKNNENQYAVLQEKDYWIEPKDIGEDVFGGIHLTQPGNGYELKEKNANLVQLGNDDLEKNVSFYINPSIQNKQRVFVLADSYINIYLKEELAETFYETFFLHSDNTARFFEYIDYYKPDIVIHENAERADRYDMIKEALNNIK